MTHPPPRHTHIIQLLHVTLKLLKALGNVVERCEPDISLHLCPGRDLIDGPLRAPNLSGLQRGGGGKLVPILTFVLPEWRERGHQSIGENRGEGEEKGWRGEKGGGGERRKGGAYWREFLVELVLDVVDNLHG